MKRETCKYPHSDLKDPHRKQIQISLVCACISVNEKCFDEIISRTRLSEKAVDFQSRPSTSGLETNLDTNCRYDIMWTDTTPKRVQHNMSVRKKNIFCPLAGAPPAFTVQEVSQTRAAWGQDTASAQPDLCGNATPRSWQDHVVMPAHQRTGPVQSCLPFQSSRSRK